MKIQDIKKGGYTLFSNKTRKMLLTLGLSMLSVYKMSALSYASPEIEGQFKRIVEEEQKKVYQVNLKDDNTNLPFKLYKKSGETEKYHQACVRYAEDNIAYEKAQATEHLIEMDTSIALSIADTPLELL